MTRPPYIDQETGTSVLPSWVCPEVEALPDRRFRLTIWVQTATNSYARHVTHCYEDELVPILRAMAEDPLHTVLRHWPPVPQWKPRVTKREPFKTYPIDLSNLDIDL